jgi:hypothetical protein
VRERSEIERLLKRAYVAEILEIAKDMFEK